MIAPSILAADFSKLGEEIEIVEKAGADLHHLDVMDGAFVPNITFGPLVVEAIKKRAGVPLDVHLMVEKPERYLSDFVQAGADYLTVHVEACTHLHRTIQEIKALGAKPGVALNPHTPISLIEDILEDIDLLVIMSVNPGFGGQSFIPATIEKVRRARALLQQRKCEHIAIEVDGGVKQENIKDIADAGANIFVSGSGVFAEPGPVKNMKRMREILENEK